MRIVQVTNLVSHHQLPLARHIASLVGENNFRFVATSPPDIERLSLGWRNNDSDPWILRAGEDESDRLEFERWWDLADVVLCGERLFKRMGDRVERDRLCFYMSERWWKPPIGIARLLSPKFAKMSGELRRLARNPAFHYLPKGPFASRDIDVVASFNQRKWRWGYFAESNTLFNRSIDNTAPLKVLWVGRMLDWKRVETLIRAVSDSSRAGTAVILTLIGNGPERRNLEHLASKLLNRCEYVFREPMSAPDVIKLMNENDVYVLPSSAYEGWGVVINEAMGCGCAVVASYSAGAAAAMIEHDVNGLLFKPGDWRELSCHLQRLANDSWLRWRLGNAAHEIIRDEWSPRCAANRFVSVADALLSHKSTPVYASGPMSRP